MSAILFFLFGHGIREEWMFQALFNGDALSWIECEALVDDIKQVQHVFLFFHCHVAEKIKNSLL